MSALRDKDLKDMQRLILQGLTAFGAAKYGLFHIAPDRVDDAKRDLDAILPMLATADQADRDGDAQAATAFKVCIAVTYAGLKRFNLTDLKLHGLPQSFKDGAASEIVARRMQDEPGDWEWRDVAADDKDDIHVLIAYFWKDPHDVDDFADLDTAKLEADWKAFTAQFQGLDLRLTLPTGFLRKDSKGHFGFRDGISQPYIEGSETQKKPRGAFARTHTVKPGQFILSHQSEPGADIPRLWVDADIDPYAAAHLSSNGMRYSKRDFGRNGSYLVFRQLRQDRQGFEDFLKEAAYKSETGDPELIAAKLVGRWRDGTPLVLSQHRHTDELSTANDFLFESDAVGLRCPIGSHIRRSYPRDSIVSPGQRDSHEQALDANRSRRIIRRGRPYYDPAKDDYGLHFLCINASIQEQFEFVQEAWVNNTNFGGMRDEVDPIVGQPQATHRGFSIQKGSMPEVLSLQPFVEVAGAGYFLLPSKSALNFLVHCDIAPDVRDTV